MRTSARDGCCPLVMDLAAWGMVLGMLGLLFLAHLWGSLTWSPLVEESHEGPGPVLVSVFSAFLKFQSPCLSHASSVFKINTLKESEGPSVSCSAEYIPFAPGDYDVNITYGGAHIPGKLSFWRAPKELLIFAWKWVWFCLSHWMGKTVWYLQ